MKFVLSCTQVEELPRYIDLIRENIPDMLETWIISGHNHVFEPDGTYTEIPFKYKEFVINLNKASDIVYFAQHIICLKHGLLADTIMFLNPTELILRFLLNTKNL